MSERPAKRIRLEANVFVDVEAQVGNEGDEDEDEELYEEEERNEEEEVYDTIESHAQLRLAIDDEGEDVWQELLQRARARTAQQPPVLDVSQGGRGTTGELWEISCTPGCEEAIAFKVLARSLHPTTPDVLARSVIGRWTSIRRIYAEVSGIDQARRLAAAISGLHPSRMRRVPPEECEAVLNIKNVPLPQDGCWLWVRGKRPIWRHYRGDTARTVLRRGKLKLLLIPRLKDTATVGRPARMLRSLPQMLAHFGPNVQKIENTHHPGGFTFGGHTFDHDGFLIADLDSVDTLPWTENTLPGLDELDLFKTSANIAEDEIDRTLIRIEERVLKIGDRVKVVSGEFKGLGANVVVVDAREVEVYIPSQDLVHRLRISEVRRHFCVGDEVQVMQGPHLGMVGWLVDVIGYTLKVVSVDRLEEVEVDALQVQIYNRPFKTTLRIRKRQGTIADDPNRVYVGKAVMVVHDDRSPGATANNYKGYKGLVKNTDGFGAAFVELEACNNKQVKLRINDLILRDDYRLAGQLKRLEDFSTTPKKTAAVCLATTSGESQPVAATPMPEEGTMLQSPAWDPAAADPQPHRPAHWLERASLAGRRIKLREEGDASGRILEFVVCEADSAMVRDGMQRRQVPLERVRPVEPSAVEDLVVPISGDLSGKLYKVKVYGEQECELRAIPTPTWLLDARFGPHRIKLLEIGSSSTRIPEFKHASSEAIVVRDGMGAPGPHYGHVFRIKNVGTERCVPTLTMPVLYPPKASGVSMATSPSAPDLEVPAGTLLHHANRNSRFPFLYRVESHPAVTNRDVVKHILVYIHDTSPEAQAEFLAFEESLEVPLGPDELIHSFGLFELEDGTVIFARPRGVESTDQDELIAGSFDGSLHLDPALIIKLTSARDAMLGNASNRGSYRTYFESLGQAGVKGGRCFSLTMTQQHPRSLVGPAAGGKVYDDDVRSAENERLRSAMINAATEAGMAALNLVLPPSILEALEENAELNNLPRVGHHGNFAFPAVQLNLAQAVSWSESLRQGLEEMGFFGLTHRDELDALAGYTSVVSGSRLPLGYEHGRFHLLGLGVYVKLTPWKVVTFCGLSLHGGTPPIAPEGQEVDSEAERVNFVCYSPESILSGAGTHVIPWGSLSDSTLLKLGPEITTHNGPKCTKISNEANWMRDGKVVMERLTHATFSARGLLQLTNFIVSQMPQEYGMQIDSSKFLESFSFEDPKTGECVSLGPWEGAPDHPGVRTQQLLRWIERMKTRARFIPYLASTNFDAISQQVREGAQGLPHHTRGAGNKDRKHPPPDALTLPTPKRAKFNPASGDRLPGNPRIQNSLNRIMTRSAVAAASRTRRSLRLAEPDDDEASLAGAHSGSDRPEELTLEGDEEMEDDEELESEDELERLVPLPIPKIAPKGKMDISYLLNESDGDTGHSPFTSEPTAERTNVHRAVSTTAAQRVGHRVDEFLQSLTVGAVDAAIGDFETALNAYRTDPTVGNKHQLKEVDKLCALAMSAIDRHPCAVGTTLTLPNLWNSISLLTQSSYFSGVDTRLMRSRVMSLALCAHYWVIRIVEAATNNPSSDSWVVPLVDAVHRHVWDTSRRTKTSIQFPSSEFLPSLPSPVDCIVEFQPMTYDSESNRKATIETTALIIRTWLGFPLGLRSIIQATVLHHLNTRVHPACLLLDTTWQFFLDPYDCLFKGASNAQRNSKKHILNVLDVFESNLVGHNMCDPGSPLGMAFQYLHVLQDKWNRRNEARREVAPEAGFEGANEPGEGSSSSPRALRGHQFMVEFLDRLAPLVSNNFAVPAGNKDVILGKVVQKLDFFLPFRRRAPTMARAMDTIYADNQRLRTGAGLLNILAFRAIFYGSSYAKEGLHWFDSPTDAQAFYDSYGSTETERQAYFINLNAYGNAQGKTKRDISNLKGYWEKRHLWTQFLTSPAGQSEDPIAFYKFFLQFRNVGRLTALLLVGDLIECSFLSTPTARRWGELVALAKGGSVKGLISLGLVSPQANNDAVATSFEALHDHITQHFSPENQALVCYNVIMLEHALCTDLPALNTDY
ncbi:hypothetical protein NLJ89_g5806 [Agrocybe chaxingu]|uniref:KOW domain-containing protein n=1 Tax=Agrocybe chaxingu TaxID=84603 RepID=A0A9W8K0D9_9AGAR|nr:hypothetical protein NLJ89_g5806 [Agrocybe chaxingu]